ncbi:MAG: PIN domain-containing protein [Pseudonocardiales bacterium]|nr:PIN domain-containing protein [Pseudonocardiales bacterium]
MGKVTLDANVVIGLFRPADAHHNAVRTELAAARERADDFILPASVLSEAMVGGYRHGTEAEMRRRILGLFGPARSVDEDVALTAAELRAGHHSLRLPDALVIATGIIENATVLTCDRRLGTVHKSVRVISPN